MRHYITLGIAVLLIFATVAAYPRKIPKEAKEIEEKEDMAKRSAAVAGAVIAGATLGTNILKDVLNAMANIQRKVAIGVENESGCTWNEPSAYFFSGTANKTLPYTVENTKALLYGPRKSTGPAATGAVGVLTYKMLCSETNTLAVLFSVPFDYNLYENWWNVKIYPGVKKADKQMYDELYNDDSPEKGDNSWHEKELGYGLGMRGTMTNSGTAILEVHVSKA